jgi:cyclic pyranopterin phosphate synthase
MSKLTHFDNKGNPRMVDVSGKKKTKRIAVARGKISMTQETIELIKNKGVSKGDVLSVATCAGIMAAKRTNELIPMCHPLGIDSCKLSFSFNQEETAVEVEANVKVAAKTGVEIEALVAVTMACLTIYDMCKSYDKGMVISDIRLISKSGGKSGEWVCSNLL